MNLKVEYKSQDGTITSQNHKITRLVFAKHFGIAGLGYAPKPQKLIRILTMCVSYNSYLRRKEFYLDRFSTPPDAFSDPTEKSHFSNLTGKAIADFLSKRIDKSLFTVNYEAAMRILKMPVKGERPDLIAFNPDSMSAIETKGYSGGSGKMAKHKAQSKTGDINVNFTVACVSYNLYKKVKCNYHDPFDENVRYDHELLKELSKRYYKGLSSFLNQRYFEYRTINVQNEDFYEIEFPYRLLEKFFLKEFHPKHFWFYEIFDSYRPRLILPKQILEYAENGITNEMRPFLFKIEKENTNTYIDNDRVGLRI